MSTTHDLRPSHWAATLALGTVLAAVLWLVTGAADMTPLGFVLAAMAGR